MAGLRVVGRTEAQRVHRCDGTGAHGEDVAQDAADARCRALVGLDIGRVVVAFHLEDDAVAVIDIDHAGVFARALNDARPLGRQRAQPLLGRLVGAVLVPHGREDAELGEGRLAPDQAEDALVFVRLQPVRCDEVRGDGAGVGNRHRRPSNPSGGAQSTNEEYGACEPQQKQGALCGFFNLCCGAARREKYGRSTAVDARMKLC